MYARVVRFTDVTSDQVDAIVSQIKESDGPPPGVPSNSLKLMFDEAQGTAVVVIFFESEEDLRKGGEALEAMDTSETPGKRASVDSCEVKVEMDAR